MTLEADYVIVGGGAMGMAFADTLLSESDATAILIDRHRAPGGHWNVAYPFVCLHQPSQSYGVNSLELSKGRIDQTGYNKGLNELATGAEVMAYYDEVMKRRLLPTGRLQYFPMSEHQGDGAFVSILSGERRRAVWRKKLVDATYLTVSAPSTHRPGFTVDTAIPFAPLNDLPRLAAPPEGYVVIGAGKTGVDACLWLLENGVDPDAVTWIMPRDAWMLDRANTQPTPEFFTQTFGAQVAQMESIAAAESIEDMFDRFERTGYMLRLDPQIRPKMFHGATISRAELEALRRIRNVVRKGRVTRLERDRIVLEHGSVPTSPAKAHVDCSARAIAAAPVKPIFDGEVITPQMARSYQPVFSAALIAHLETAYGSDEEKNQVCGPVPLPDTLEDFVHFTLASMMNQYHWSQRPELQKWLLSSRLDSFSSLAAGVDRNDAEKTALLKRMKQTAPQAVAKLIAFQTEIKEQSGGN